MSFVANLMFQTLCTTCVKKQNKKKQVNLTCNHAVILPTQTTHDYQFIFLCTALGPSHRNPPVAIVEFQMLAVLEVPFASKPSLSHIACQDTGLVWAFCSHVQHLQPP